MIMYNIGSQWIPHYGDLVVGTIYRRYHSNGGYVEFTHNNDDAFDVECLWVLSELKRTDELVKLPDYPHINILITYRDELRKYDKMGVRPIAPTTPNGTSI